MNICCNTCIHEGICKYEEECRKKITEVENCIKLGNSSLFSIAITCHRHDSKRLSSILPEPIFPTISDPIYIPTSPTVREPIITCNTSQVDITEFKE